MAYSTVEEIIKPAILDALKMEESIPASFIKAAVNFYNASEPFVWRKWPWHNRKIDEISVSADSNGVIVFDGVNSDVDMVRAVKAVDASGDASLLIWHEDSIRAAIKGDEVSSGRFDQLSDDVNGNRRIKISAEDGVDTYKVLAFRRFVKAEVNDTYNSDDPSATPNDYRVLTWKIDRAEAALIEHITDKLRKWNNMEATGTWNHALNGSISDIKKQEAREQLITPACGMFGETGSISDTDNFSKTSDY